MNGTIDFKPLETTPSKAYSKSHYFCDYIELLALCDSDDGVSQSDVYDRFLEDGKINDIGSENASESNESWNNRIYLWFSEIESRAHFYGDGYPFEIYNGRLKKKDTLVDIHFVYFSLLLSSLISYIRNYHVLTSTFELISSLALSNYLPRVSRVHIFGVSSLDNDRYTGSLENKMTLLASDLNLTKSTKANVFKQGDNGDGGVDLVAWVPFEGDPTLAYFQIYLCQCAAGKDWTKKQASVERVENYLIDIPDNTQNVLFVPYDFRDAERYFSEPGEITASLVFDRHRILTLVEPNEVFSGKVGKELKNYIETAVEFEEDIV
ncbi:hypothetical protein ABS858_13255 [Vibrio neptunius]|uniref:hypothetical protein n=1 Tax=Vibrio neptunius TaxID=170651 RepID=UPI003315646A